MSAIFISHSSKDNEAAGVIIEQLRKWGHRSVFLDFDPADGIPAGRDWEKELYRQLGECRAVIVLCSEHSMASKWCFAEIAYAKALGKHIFPIKIAPCLIHSVLTDVQIIDLTTDHDAAYQRLERGLASAGLDPGNLFDWDGSRPPYPGLMAFEEADAAIFFGRDADIQTSLDILNRVQHFGGSRWVLLLGASGSGKSSLMRAGLLPRLKQDQGRWLVVDAFRPLQRPFNELAMVLSKAFGRYGVTRDCETIREKLWEAAKNPDRDGYVLTNLATDLLIAAGQRQANVLLAVDQFEELLGYAHHDQANRFLPLLRAALEVSESPLVTMGALRSDFLGSLQRHPALRELQFVGIPVGVMGVDGFAQVIEGPAALVGLDLEAGLVQTMVNDTETDDALPLLAFTLRELWDRYGKDGRLTIDEYRDRLGGLHGSVARAAEAVMQAKPMSGDQKDDLRRAFLAMVRINEEGQYVRRPADWNDLPQRSHEVLERFVNARLLIIRGDGQKRVVEVAHEALFRDWKQLKIWLDNDREFLLWQHRLHTAVADWERVDRDKEALLRGAQLVEAKRWLEQRGDNLDALEQDFIRLGIDLEARRREQEEERRQRELERERKARRIAQRTAIGALAAGLILTVLVVLSAIQFRRVEVEQILMLGISSEQQLVLNQDLEALVTGLQAGDKLKRSKLQTLWPQPNLREEVTKRLHKVIYGVRERNRMQHKDRVHVVRFSPNGELLTTAEIDGTVRLWNLAGEQLMEFEGSYWGTGIDFSADGQLLATTESGIVHLWQLEGDQMSGLKEWGNNIRSVNFGPHGKLIATVEGNGTTQLWNLEGRQIAAFQGNKDGVDRQSYVTSVKFSPNGDLLATTEWGGTVRLWDLEGKQLAMFQVENSEFDELAFSPDGKVLATAEDGGVVRIWNLKGEPLTKLEGHTGPVHHIAFSPDGQRVATAGIDWIARLWDVEGNQIAELKGHDERIWDIVFSPDGNLIATASWDGTARLWNLWGDQVAEIKGHRGIVDSVSFSPNGELLATCGNDRTARIWDLGDKYTTWFDQHSWLSSADLSPDGELLVIAGMERSTGDHTVSSWDWSGNKLGEMINLGPESFHRIYSVDFSPDGQLIATAEEGGFARLWHLDGRQLVAFQADISRLLQVVFSPDGELVATTGTEGLPRLWNVEGELLVAFQAARTRLLRVDFSPDGRLLATAGEDGSVHVWDLNGNQITEFSAHQGDIRDIAFSLDSQRLVTAGEDRIARLWDLEGNQLARFEGHQESVDEVIFSPDGQFLATAGNDDTARLWDLKGNQLAEFRYDRDDNAVRFSPDGQQLVTIDAYGSIKRWPIEGLDELMRRGCDWARDFLTNNPEARSFRYLCDGW